MQKKRIIAGVLAFFMVFGMLGTNVKADDESDLADLQDRQEQIEQEQYENSEKLEKAQQKVDEVSANVKALDEEISVTESEIQDLDKAIEENLALLDTTKVELENAEADEKIWYSKLKMRIRAMYESGNANYVEVLLQADSVSELFTKAEYSKQLAQYDREIMDGLTECRETIQTSKATIEKTEAQLEANRASEETKKEELSEQKGKKEKELQSLQEDADALALYEAKLAAQRDEVLGEIAAKEAEIEEARRQAEEEERRRKAEERRRKQQEQQQSSEDPEEDSSDDPYVDEDEDDYEDDDEDTYEDEDEDEGGYEDAYTGGYIWPLPGYSYLSTYFGVGGHRGIDIPAPSGTPILAVGSGTVITSGWNDSYGNYVAISHGNGVVTLYAHASALLVSAGQYVTAGTPVTLCGTTGYSTGNHLHLEFQVNGYLQNPLNYVSP